MTRKKKFKNAVSPYLLCQEIYVDNPWRMMVCCILLNRTQGRQVHSIREELFGRWPDPSSMSGADHDQLRELLRPLGFYNKRASLLKEFSQQWSDGDWSDVSELKGIGKYARDSYSIFVEKRIDGVTPTDKVLNRYLEWRSKSDG